MKKILLGVMVVLAFTACSQNEEIENVTKSKAMKFNTAVMKNTKAGVVDNVNGKFKCFKLYAYSGQNTIINGTEFNYTDSWAAKDNAMFYWPGTELVNFYGYSVETDNVTISTDNVVPTPPTLTYTVLTDLTKQEDFLVASINKAYSEGNASVEIPFTHALTKMSFKIKGSGTADVKYTITKIEITAKTTGTYTFGSGWNGQATEGTFSLAAPSNAIEGGALATDLNKDLMMIPQSDAKISVTYTVTAYGNPVTVTSPKLMSFPEWVLGKNIAYTITLDGPNAMNITGNAGSGWDSEAPSELP